MGLPPLPDCPLLDEEIREHRKMIERELGSHDERLRTLEREVGEIRSDVKLILARVNSAEGGWKTLVAVAAAAGSVGAFVGKFLPILK